MKPLISLLFFILFTSTSFAQLTNRLDRLDVNDLKTKKLEVISTTSGSIPCPKMTQTERNNIASPIEGQCIYNSTVQTLNLYDGSAWVEVAGGGGGGGIDDWQASKFYQVGDVVIYSDEIYQCIEEHTSGVSFDPTKFQILAQNLDNSYGVLSMSKGGTEKALTPQLGGIVYTDAGSMEVLAAGVSGKFLQSNGAAAPSWESISIDDSSFSGVLSLEKGGTNKNLNASDGAIAYSDADSLELLAPGSAGQILQSNGVGAPSFVNKSISAKAGNNSSVTIEEVQVANNQLTETDTNKHLIETGNKNILTNPSFEAPIVSNAVPGWTIADSSRSGESSIVIDGKQSLKATFVGDPLNLIQDSTLYASQFADGVQGLGMVRVKTSVSGLKFCARKAGVTQTSLCVDIQSNNSWGLYKIPFVFGGTSNGIVITSSGASVAGDIYFDDAFLGAVDLKQDLEICGSADCKTSFSAKIASGSLNITSQDEIFIASVSSGGTGINNGTFVPGLFSVTPSCRVTANGETMASFNSISTTSFQVITRNSVGTLVNGAYEISCDRQGADYISAKAKSSGSVYSSTNADTDWQSCQFSTLAWQGLGTVTASNLRCKRQGSELLMRGNFLSGTGTASEARIPLPIWNGSQLSTASSLSGPVTGRIVRGVAATGSNKDHIGLLVSSANYFNVGIIESNNSLNPLSAQPGNTLFALGETVGVEIRIPIEGWENSNIIVGQFNGLESCTDSYECTDTFSAFIDGAGTVSGENVDWINGNCTLSATSLYTCLYKTGLAGNGNNLTNYMNCSAIPVDNTAVYRSLRVQTTNTSGVSIYSWASSTNAASTGAGMHLICQKQGADYIGKTAKAVASDQNVRSIGAVGVDIQSVYFGGSANCETACTTSPCIICNKVGGKITSVTRNSAGSYNFNGIDGTKYNCTGSALAGGGVYGAIQHVRALSSSTHASIFTGAGGSGTSSDAARASVTCIGIP